MSLTSTPLYKVYRKARFGEPVIVVSGLPRSGTSLTMRMLAMGGVPILADDTRGADESNPLGYFEYPRVERLNVDTDREWLREARGRAVKVISFLLTYLPESLNYKVLFVNRDLDEVIASQDKMLSSRGEAVGAHGGDDLRREYQNHLLRIDVFLRRRPWFERLDVDYNRMVADPGPEARRMAAFLGVAVDIDRMAEAVSPDLYRNRRPRTPRAWDDQR